MTVDVDALEQKVDRLGELVIELGDEQAKLRNEAGEQVSDIDDHLSVLQAAHDELVRRLVDAGVIRAGAL